MPAYSKENEHKRPTVATELTIDNSLRCLVLNKEKLDHDHLMALGGIIASRKEDKKHEQDLTINKCIDYLFNRGTNDFTSEQKLKIQDLAFSLKINKE